MPLPWWLFVHSGSVLVLYIIAVVYSSYIHGVKESSVCVCVVITATHAEFKLATQSFKHGCEYVLSLIRVVTVTLLTPNMALKCLFKYPFRREFYPNVH